MDSFRVIYKILKHLERMLRVDEKEILTSASKYPCNNQGNIVRNGVDYGV